MDAVVTVQRLRTYANFVKLEHTVFSLPLIYAGLWLGAHGRPSTKTAIVMLFAAIGGRVAAMGLNRIIDAEIDRRNPRTQGRELPRGMMTLREGWGVVGVAVALYLASATAIAPICLQLAWIPLLLFVGYPYLKRLTSLCHVGLGLAWSTAPLAGWFAGARSLERIGEVGWLWVFALLWVTGFDIIYATMDEAFDRTEGLHALPAQIGKRPALKVAALVHGVAFSGLVMLWRTQLHSTAALLWLLAIGALLLWQHGVAERRPEFAFFQLNGLIGFLVFACVLSGQLSV